MSIFYDAQDSANEAMACAQIEFDKLSLLYVIGCESDTAGDNMPLLCAAFDVSYEALQQFSPAPF